MTEHEKQTPDTAPETPDTAPPAEETKGRHKGRHAHKADAEAPGHDQQNLAAQLAAAEENLAEARQQTSEARDALLRTAAEYDNFRKRSRAEHDAAFNNGVGYAAVQLLPVIDILEAAANAPTTDEEYKKGVLLTLAKFEEIFQKLGIAEIEAAGQPFDPELHNACMQEACEGVESGCVSRVVQKGYRLGDKVLRHSVVAVVP